MIEKENGCCHVARNRCLICGTKIRQREEGRGKRERFPTATRDRAGVERKAGDPHERKRVDCATGRATKVKRERQKESQCLHRREKGSKRSLYGYSCHFKGKARPRRAARAAVRLQQRVPSWEKNKAVYARYELRGLGGKKIVPKKRAHQSPLLTRKNHTTKGNSSKDCPRCARL